MNALRTHEALSCFFRTGATRLPAFRREQLQRLQQAILVRESDIAAALHADLRKSPLDAYTTEIGFVLADIRHAMRCLKRWMKPQRRPTPPIAWPARSHIHAEPFGVALILGPWNYPFQLLLSPLVGAMAAGNCAVLKPSELAPHTSALIATLLGETFPPHYIKVEQGDHLVAQSLLQERFDKIFFTGSTRVGRLVMTAAAGHLTPVTLELGGKCPAIVCADAPLDIAARRIAWGKFLNAGQTCVAPDYVVVDSRISAPFIAALQRAILDFFGADPRNSPHFGRIINAAHHRRLVQLLAGGRIIHGGEHDVDDLYMAPALLRDAQPDAPVMQEEIFGPILPVCEFSRLEDVLAELATRPTPLALYLFSSDRSIQKSVVDRSRSGGVCINDTILHITGRELPLGGLGESGMGSYRGRAGFDAFSHHRSVMTRPAGWDPGSRYPPARVSLAVVRRLYRRLLCR